MAKTKVVPAPDPDAVVTPEEATEVAKANRTDGVSFPRMVYRGDPSEMGDPKNQATAANQAQLDAFLAAGFRAIE